MDKELQRFRKKLVADQGRAVQLTSRDDVKTALTPELKLSRALQAAGIASEHLHPELRDNLLCLGATKIIGDELTAVGYFNRAARYAESQFGADTGFSPESATLIRQATLLSDSGKAGWLGASAEEKKCLTQLHSEDRPFALDDTLEDYIEAFFRADDALQQQRLAHDPTIYSAADLKVQIAKMSDHGITLAMSMQDFFHRHVRWSYDLIMASTLNNKTEIAKTAELHHFLEGILPFPIDYATTDINTLMTREVIWVIILDKYDAQIRRAKAEPTAAIAWLHDYIEEDKGGGLALIPDDEQRQQLQKRLHRAIDELASSLSGSDMVKS